MAPSGPAAVHPWRRWLVLAACLVVESVAGSSYAFAVYSNDLKERFGYSQEGIQTAGSIGNLGLYLAIVAGLFFDAAGPAPALVIGSLLAGGGYALLWAASNGGMVPTNVSSVALYCFLWSHGSSWFDTAALSTAVKNFPRDRGGALGLLKALFGLSASLLTLCYGSLFRPDVTSFLAFLAVLLPTVGIACSLVIRVMPPEVANVPLFPRERVKVICGYVGVASVAGYISAIALGQQTGAISNSPALAYALVPIILFVASIILVPVAGKGAAGAEAGGRGSRLLGGDGEEGEEGEGDEAGLRALGVSRVSGGSEADRSSVLLDDSTASALLVGDSAHSLQAGGSAHGGRAGSSASAGAGAGSASSSAAGASAAARLPGSTLVEGAFSLDFLLLCIILFCGTGAGLTVINNLGSIAKALGAGNDGQDVYVTVLSISNCLGRATFGFLSDALAHRLSRPGWFTVIVVLMGIAQTVLVFADLSVLYAGVALAGFAYGGFWSVCPALVADRFGTKAFAATYSLSSFWTAIASYTMSATMASEIYQSHVPAGQTDCDAGQACFREAFLVLAGMCAFATLVGLLLTRRLRGLYDSKGRALPYNQWRRMSGGRISPAARSAKRFLAPLCCCAYGRSLVVDEGEDDGDDYEDDGEDRRRGDGVSFDGDLSVYTSSNTYKVTDIGSPLN
jgi:hypothetical protein